MTQPRRHHAPLARVCPACARRGNAIIAGDCPICTGHGVLILGRPALLRYRPQVVAIAVEYAFELQAEKDLGHGVPLGVARRHLTEMVLTLARAGLLHSGSRDTAPPGRDEQDNPVQSAMAALKQAKLVAVEASGVEWAPGTATMLRAPAIRFEPSEVPVDGSLPGFSRAGFLCFLAQVSDPLDQLAVRPPADRVAQSDAVLTRQGETLGAAVRLH